MVMLLLAFVFGLISANWINLQFNDRLIQLLSTGFDRVKCLTTKGIEMSWNRYQLHQHQEDISLNGAAPQQEVDLLRK